MNSPGRLRGDRPTYARLASRLLILISSGIMVVIFSLTMNAFERRNFFPDAAHRFQITTIGMAPLAAVCPETGERVEIGVVEDCIRTGGAEVGAHHFRAVTIPPVADYLSKPMPSFGALLRDQNRYDLVQVITSKQPWMIRITAPAKYFARNELGITPWALIMNGLQDGRVCIEDNCRYFASKYEQNGLVFPLLTDRRLKGDSGHIYIIGADPAFPMGLSVFDSLFLTPVDQTFHLRQRYPLALYGKAFIFAMAFIGIFLMALGFALLWAEFVDYAAFCNLATAFGIFSLADNIVIGTPGTSTSLGIKSASIIYLVGSALIFALAAGRLKPLAIVMAVLTTAALAGLTALAVTMPADLLAAATTATYVRATAALGLLLVPGPLCALFAWHCFHRRRQLVKSQSALSAQLDLRRRTQELLFYAVILATIGFDMARQYAFSSQATGMQMSSTPVSMYLITLTFAGLLYHTAAKIAKTHFRRDSSSEAIRLKGRLSAEAYQQWLAENRSGVMMQIDVKNSSVAAMTLQSHFHAMMNTLSNQIHDEHQRAGFHHILAKRNGDEILILLSRQSDSLRTDLEQIITRTFDCLKKWEDSIQRFAPGCRLHINIYALSQYTLAASGRATVNDYNSGDDADPVPGTDQIDFTSREANFMMKYSGKPSHAGTVRITAPEPATSPRLAGTPVNWIPLAAHAQELADGVSQAQLHAMNNLRIYTVQMDVPGAAAPSSGAVLLQPVEEAS